MLRTLFACLGEQFYPGKRFPPAGEEPLEAAPGARIALLYAELVTGEIMLLSSDELRALESRARENRTHGSEGRLTPAPTPTNANVTGPRVDTETSAEQDYVIRNELAAPVHAELGDSFASRGVRSQLPLILRGKPFGISKQ